MRYAHTMIRVTNLEKSLHFYTQALKFVVVKKTDYEKGQFTLVFLRAGDERDGGPLLELTYNWGVNQYVRGDAYGHMAYRVQSIEAIRQHLKSHGYDLSWGPDKAPDGKKQIAFIDDPDGYEIELIEET